MAKFLVRDTFNVTGRGLMIVGDITLGAIKPGDFLLLRLKEETAAIKITGVDRSSKINQRVGLLIADAAKEKIEKLDLKGKELTVVEPDDIDTDTSIWEYVPDLTDLIDLDDLFPDD